MTWIFLYACGACYMWFIGKWGYERSPSPSWELIRQEITPDQLTILPIFVSAL